MEKDEFILKLKELGHSESEIDEIVKDVSEAENSGIKVPYHIYLMQIEKPTTFP